jgi:hypothetical protein
MEVIGFKEISKAKKAHTCDWCGETIEVGSSYNKWAWIDSGIVTVRAHVECFDASMDDDRLNGLYVYFDKDRRRGCICTREDDCEICERKVGE